MLNKAHWIVDGQIGAHNFYPSYDTPHPLITSEFIIGVCDIMLEHEETLIFIAGLTEPLIQAILAQRNYKPGTPTLYSMLWQAYVNYTDDADTEDIVSAINLWIGTMFRFRLSQLEDIRRAHIKMNPKGKNIPPYMLTTPKFTSAAGDDPILTAMERIFDVLAAYHDANREALKTTYNELYSSNDAVYVSTSHWLLKHAISNTTLKWQKLDIDKGAKNRTNVLRNLAYHFFIATHAIYAQKEQGVVYEGWDTEHLAGARFRDLINVLGESWSFWVNLGPVKSDANSEANEQNFAYAQDISQFHSMRNFDSQVASANDVTRTLYNLLMKNPLFHCYAVNPVTDQPEKTLKKSAAKLMDDLVQIAQEEVEHASKHLLQKEYDYDEPLSIENRKMIVDNLVKPHANSFTPSHKDLGSWHSPNNMTVLNRTERDINPDLARLDHARTLHLQRANKPKVEERTFRRLPTIAVAKVLQRAEASKRTGVSQQLRDAALIRMVESRVDREIAAAKKGKMLKQKTTSELESDDDQSRKSDHAESEEGVHSEEEQSGRDMTPTESDCSSLEPPPANQQVLTQRASARGKRPRSASNVSSPIAPKKKKSVAKNMSSQATGSALDADMAIDSS
ncbi:hypothetical protein C0995_013516 [Termitomyces sp. Mi166|nr:hypothetical protein C0995_013516 [Termitomyces sp. Mi166\